MLRRLVPRGPGPLWESQQPRMQEIIGRGSTWVAWRKGMIHTWPDKEGVLLGRTLVCRSSKKNAGCRVRWPDSLRGLPGRWVVKSFHYSWVSFLINDTHHLNCISKDVGSGVFLDIMASGTSTPFLDGILTTFRDFPFLPPLVQQSPRLQPHPTARLTQVNEDTYLRRVTAGVGKWQKTETASTEDWLNKK